MGMNLHGQRGMSPLGVLALLVFIIILLLVFNMGYILSNACGEDDDFIDCALEILLEQEPEPAPQGSVTATGLISGEYGGETRSVTVNMVFPLEGGVVSGNFSGDCDGTIKGTYESGSSAISGTGKGSCAFVLPASGEFSGSVNREAKTVYVNGKGSVPGFSGEGSLTLTY